MRTDYAKKKANLGSEQKIPENETGDLASFPLSVSTIASPKFVLLVLLNPPSLFSNHLLERKGKRQTFLPWAPTVV